jgi:hypothetical protein
MSTATEETSTGVAKETASPSEADALEALGKVIEELHDLAQRSMRTSLDGEVPPVLLPSSRAVLDWRGNRPAPQAFLR